MNISNGVKILPGGKLTANWIDITAKSLSIDGSGEISAAGAGFLQGPGAGTGELSSGFQIQFVQNFSETLVYNSRNYTFE